MPQTRKGTPRRDGFSHAGRIRNPPGMLDALARAGGIPGAWVPDPAPSGLCQGRPGDFQLRTGQCGGVGHGQWENARHLLPENVRAVEISSNDAWMRGRGDRRSSRMADGRLRGVGLAIQCLGAVFQAGFISRGDKDSLGGSQGFSKSRAPDRYRAPFIMEGRFHFTWMARGTLLTTEECLLNPNRNPTPVRARRSRKPSRPILALKKSSGWEKGCMRMKTNGHVDKPVLFRGPPGEILLTWTDDEKRPPARDLPRGPLERFGKRGPMPKGRAFTVHKTPSAGPPFTLTRNECRGTGRQ